MDTFKDHFSRQAAIYAQFRPVYPEALFAYLSSLTTTHDLAWDCGTGSGQCAIQLVNFYDSVYASDPSTQQISHAQPHERITYKVEKAEQSGLRDNSADLITVAQALHWFDFDRFYTEVNRVLKPGGVLAAIAYINPRVAPVIDKLVDELHDNTLKDFWRAENRMVEQEYTTIPFPFTTIEAPAFNIEKEVSREAFTGHIRTWSAIQRYIDTCGINPVDQLEREIAQHWNPHEIKTASWKLILKTGRKD